MFEYANYRLGFEVLGWLFFPCLIFAVLAWNRWIAQYCTQSYRETCDDLGHHRKVWFEKQTKLDAVGGVSSV